MGADSWLSLLNYSAKYGISLSTLRRRIKGGTIDFKLDNGKYFIIDDPQESSDSKPSALAPKDNPPAQKESASQMGSLASSNFVEASVLTSANRLVEELKAAYAKILLEKEEQITQLKEEIVDLRMLVRILEEQNNKSRPQVPTSADDIFFGR